MPVQCQADSQGDYFGDGQLDSTWGDAGQVFVEYLLSTHKIVLARAFAGYEGTMTSKSPDGLHTYVISVNGIQITKDGQPWNFHFADDVPCVAGDLQSCFRTQADELYRAILATFAPQLPMDPVSENCFDNGHCISGNFGDVAYLFIPSTGWGMWTLNRHAGITKISKPDWFDLYPTKILGFSVANPMLKLDAVGPVGVVGTLANPGKLGQATQPCVVSMDYKFSDFLSACVQVTGSAASDQTELNKLLGGITHSTERYFFDVSGIDLNFSATTLSPMSIVSDTDVPKGADDATEFNVDQSTLGKFLNDRDITNNYYDYHGFAAVYQEYARLVRTNLLALKNITDGGAAACLTPAGLAANAWCTGMEGMIQAIPGATAASNTATNVGQIVTSGGAQVSSIDLFHKYIQKIGGPSVTSGLKLGHQGVVFCDDADGNYTMAPDPNDNTKKVFLPATGYKKCTAAGDTMTTTYDRVLHVFGKDNVSNLPTEAQDTRFYWKMWTQAFFKYLLAEGQGANINDLSGVKLDPYALFFDSSGAGQFEQAEYIDRSFASPTSPPFDINLTADVKNGIYNDYSFSNFLYRGENALYNAIMEDRSHGIGQEEALLTNVFGSPVLAAGWQPVKNNGTVVHLASECATATPAICTAGKGNCQLGNTAAAMGCQYGPPVTADGDVMLDDLGKPYLAAYAHIIDHGATPFALNMVSTPPAWVPTGTTDKGSPVKILMTDDFIGQALIQVPIMGNCTGSLPCSYDPFGSSPTQTVKYLVPYAPQQPGIGFGIPLNGQIDKFISTSQLDLSGTTVSANIDYTITPDASGKGQNVNFLAVETQDFLGEVFVCQDAATRELLTARMYTSVQTMTDWIDAHPKAKDDCQIIIRYSPFNNYPDFITSLTNGVKLSVTQGSGFGRIVDATLFVPGQ
jgi:hypothetical protein